jgi:SAM-dependent methyltransferase/acyl carrier protein
MPIADPTPNATPSDEVAGLWSATLAAASSRAALAPVDMAVASYRSAWEALNQLAALLGRNALATLGAFRTAGAEADIDAVLAETGIRPIYRQIVERWLDGLVASDQLSRTTSGYRAESPLEPVELENVWDRVESTLAGDPPLLAYVRHCGTMVAEVLSGRTSALETLFPGGSFELAAELYHESAFLRYVNGIAAAALEQYVAQRPAGTPVRVLEIGAGTGGTTASLVRVLPADRTDYLYTDVSEIFLDYAGSRFADVPFLRTGLFDLEKEPAEQGYGEGEWDVVVAANVVHAARDIRGAVDRVRRLLAPGGIVLLVESTGHHPWHDITTGLIEGWQHFEDDLRTDTPLLTPEMWVELLRSAGFAAAATLPGDSSPAGVLKQHVVIASVGGVAAADAPPAMSVLPKPMEEPATSAPAAARAATDPSPPVSAALAAILDAPEADREEIAAAQVRDAVVAVLRLDPDRPPARDARLMDLGLDSLMAVRLRNMLQQKLELAEPLPSTLVFDYPTIRQIARFVVKRSADAPSATTASSAPTVEQDLAGLTDEEVEALLITRLEAEEIN